jgi:hypothetical protein
MLGKDLADFLSAYGLNDLAQKARRGEYNIGGLWPEGRIVVDLHSVGRPDLAGKVRRGRWREEIRVGAS